MRTCLWPDFEIDPATCWPELLEQLQETVRHLETHRTITPDHRDLTHLQISLTRRGSAERKVKNLLIADASEIFYHPVRSAESELTFLVAIDTEDQSELAALTSHDSGNRALHGVALSEDEENDGAEEDAEDKEDDEGYSE